MNYFLTQKVKGTTYYFQIMGIYVVLHSRNISNTYITTLWASMNSKSMIVIE